MKYVSTNLIREAISQLSQHHVFFGTTFLVLKQVEAPVGNTMRIGLDRENDTFLKRYYRIHPKSDHFFTPFKKTRGQTNWVKPGYASKTIQTMNTQSFRSALLHERGDNVWGWSCNYIAELVRLLPRRLKIPLFYLSVWIYKLEPWQDTDSRQHVCDRFIKEFQLTAEELAALFDTEIITGLSEDASFQPLPAKWQQILEGFGLPEDVPPEHSGTLQLLVFEGLGPVKKLRLNPAQRLNLITGDNGLGKTFLLDLIWWALTQEWAERPIIPFDSGVSGARVEFLVASSSQSRPMTAVFDAEAFQWQIPRHLPAVSGLVIYARVDGSFAVWDPVNVVLSGAHLPGQRLSVVFDREEVWNGKEPQIEGLIRDWVKWQSRPDKYPVFYTFEKLLKRVGPPDLGDVSIGEPIRLRGEKKDIPTLKHSYATVPIIYESAGIRRIITLAYLITWAWDEHRIQAKQTGRKEERQMVIILDEAEAHLHPKWQRVLLPALLGIAGDLHEELAVQFFVATHSPLVLASAEPVFDPEKDKLFHLDIPQAGKVTFSELAFAIQGSSDSWLESNVFGLRFAGSRDAERALRRANEMLERGEAQKSEVEEVSKELAEHLAAEDPFWMRWVLFASAHGVEL
jgi:hypothetical protein